ncbi:MAG: hypothetical protein ACREBR_01605 [bacterium]
MYSWSTPYFIIRLTDIGWGLTTASTHTVVYDKSKGDKCYTHKILPLLYMLTYTECQQSYSYFFDVLQNLPVTHLGYRTKLRITHIPQDRAGYIRSGAQSAFGEEVEFLTLCDSVHLKRKFTDGSHHSLKDSSHKKIIRSNLDVLGSARTHALFVMMCEVYMHYWKDILQEDKWADSFHKTY